MTRALGAAPPARTSRVSHIDEMLSLFEATSKRHGSRIAMETVLERSAEVSVSVAPVMSASGAPTITPVTTRAIRYLTEAVAGYYDVPAKFIAAPNGKHRSRDERVCAARRELMFRLRLLGFSLVDVGRLAGSRNHATVIYSIRLFERDCAGRADQIRIESAKGLEAA